MATFDLSILPIQRENGQESAELPGLLAVTPPRKTARGREHDTLVLYLTLSGNAPLAVTELRNLLNNTATAFYQTTGSLTFAMRKLAENINTVLLERNLATTGRGQYALGYLVLAVVRNEQCTLLLSGPAHAVWVTEGKSRHMYDPALSGKGLGSSQSIQSYFSQVEFHAQDLLALCGKFPKDWEADLLSERPPASLEASYRKLTMAQGDLNAALIQAHAGHGTITILRPQVGAARQTQAAANPFISAPSTAQATEAKEEPQAPIEKELDEIVANAPTATSSITEEELDALADFAAHMVQPSAYAIPPQPDTLSQLPQPEASNSTSSSSRGFPSSIPRSKSDEPVSTPLITTEPEAEEESAEPEEVVVPARKRRRERSNAHAEATRQMAKVMVGGIKTGRRLNERIGAFFRGLIPRLLPGADATQATPSTPTYILAFIAIVIPVVVTVVSVMVYLRYGQSVQYDELYGQALNQRAVATSDTDPLHQRDAWQSVLDTLDKADAYRQTKETEALRAEAQTNLDRLMGVLRLEFIPAFPNGVGSSAHITRMAASESELYMLDADRGDILHASFSGRSLSLDSAFNCEPGTYAGYQVGPLVDVLALPKVNGVGATVLGIDANGMLLYCSPGQVPQAFPLPPLPNTNWGRITAFALDNGNLYVLDAPSRAVWVFVGKDSTFLDTPYFYFGNQIPAIDSAIDMAVSGDDMYLLHSDGHLTTCTFSRIAETPTRCEDPALPVDNFPAHQDINVFAQAHFTQLTLTSPPNPVILLLDADHQSVYRLTPRSLELQNEVTGYAGKANPFQTGAVGAMAVNPNYVLYLAVGNQVYFATNLP